MTVNLNEEGERVKARLEDLRDSSINSVKEKARQINHAISDWDVTLLLNQGFQEFSKSVEKEFTTPPAKKLAELMLPSFKKDFFGFNFLEKEVVQILKPFLKN